MMMGTAPAGSCSSTGCSVGSSEYGIFGSLSGRDGAEEFSFRNGGKDCETPPVVPWLQQVIDQRDGERHSVAAGGTTRNKRRYSRREREYEPEDQCVPSPAPLRRKLDDEDDSEEIQRLLTTAASTEVFTAEKQKNSSPSDIQRVVEDRYRLGECIGEGMYSKVYRVSEIGAQQDYAMKVINKNNRKLLESGNLYEKEIQILRSLKQHPCIVQVHNVLRSGTHVCVVMDLAEGGDFYNRLKRVGHFSEERSRDVVEMILSGVLHLHQSGVTHRDLKLENILCRTQAYDSDVLISDFGLAHQRKFKSDKCVCSKEDSRRCEACRNFFSMSGGNCMSTTCGTPEYLSPEMLDGDIYSEKVDLWAVGVVTYALLSGEMPFSNADGSGRGRARMYRKIKEASYSFEGEIWDAVSESAKHFISSLLCVDVDKRLDAQSALQHSWLSKTNIIQ